MEADPSFCLELGNVDEYICNNCVIKNKGLVYYDRCFADMFCEVNYLISHKGVLPQIWLLEHYPVFTAGLAASPDHFSLINPLLNNIPFIFTDRGGQVTYHGPGQIVLYLLVNVRDLFSSSPRRFVSCIEETLVEVLRSFEIDVHIKPGHPGIYFSDSKLISLGLKFRQGWSYHGIAINVDMDLSPFYLINPCGNQGMKMTQLKNIKSDLSKSELSDSLVWALTDRFMKLGGDVGGY